MAVEIDSLEINISTSSRKAANGIDKLTASLEKLLAVTRQDFGLERLAKGLAKINKSVGGLAKSEAAKNIKEIAKSVGVVGKAMAKLDEETDAKKESGGGFVAMLKNFVGYGKTLKDFQKNAKKSLEPIKKLLSAIGRVALYRAIRAGLKMIVQATKEGVQNVYQFSKLSGGSFSKSMDEAATSILYMKNALGSALAPILQALLPTVIQLADGFSTVANKIAEVMAAFNGETTFMKAKKSATEYAKAVNEATKATLKFDELNQLTNKDENSIADMFETADISGGAAKVGQTIRQNLAIIASITGMVAIALGVLLVFAGQLGVGLGLIVLGALSLNIAKKQLNSDEVSEKVKGIADTILEIGGIVSVMVGVLLLFVHMIPLGLGLIAAGAGALAVGRKTLSGDEPTSKIQAICDGIVTGISAVACFIGVLLCLSGNIPLGLGFLAMGGVGLATEIGFHWDAIKSDLSQLGSDLKSILGDSEKRISFIIDMIDTFFNISLGAWSNTGLKPILDAIREIAELVGKITGSSFGNGNIWSSGGGSYGGGGVGIGRRSIGLMSYSLADQGGYAVTPAASGFDIAGSIGSAVAGAIANNATQGGSNAQQAISVNVYLDGKQIAANTQGYMNNSGSQIASGGIYNGTVFA